MVYALLADLLVLVHLCVVAFIIGGQAVILVGAALGWAWVRQPLFRLAHLLAVAFVAVNALLGILCPLTTWEYALRARAGQTVEEEISFIARLVRQVIYYDLPPWVFTTMYVLFALLVVGTYVFFPPRPLRRPR